MIRILGPVFVLSSDWPVWRRSVRPWLRLAAAALVFDVLMLWAIVVDWFARNVRFGE